MRIVKKPRRRRRKEEKLREDIKTGSKLRDWFVKKDVVSKNDSDIDSEVIGRVESLKEKLGMSLGPEKEAADLKKENFRRIRDVFEVQEVQNGSRKRKPDDSWIGVGVDPDCDKSKLRRKERSDVDRQKFRILRNETQHQESSLEPQNLINHMRLYSEQEKNLRVLFLFLKSEK